MEYILPACLTYAKDIHCGLTSIYDTLRKSLQKLETDGIVFNIDGTEIHVYFVISYFTGDNLGMNTILGYVRSFRVDFCCRICAATYKQIQQLVDEIETLLRRNLESALGIKEICPFEEIASFYVNDCVSVDIFHDFNEGILHDGICHLLKSLIDNNIIDINMINNKKKNFEYYTTNEKKKLCQDITKDNINDNKLKMSGSQIATFFKYLPIMLGEFVEEDNAEWDLMILLYNLMNSAHKNSYNDEDLLQLKEDIRLHHTKYKNLHGNLKYKHHVITHYPTVIKLLGPLKHMSTVRMESFHQLLKNYSNVTRNHQNILFSLSDKLEFHNAYNIYKTNESKIQNKNPIKLNLPFVDVNIYDSVRHLLSNCFKLYNQCIIYSTAYNVDDIINHTIIGPETDFYKISYFVKEQAEVSFICKKIVRRGYNRHIKCHIVELDSNDVFYKINIINVDSLPFKMIDYKVNNELYNKDHKVIVDCNF